jgi:hypothetical protein
LGNLFVPNAIRRDGGAERVSNCLRFCAFRAAAI